MTLSISAAARSHPSRVFVITDDRSYTYAEIAAQARAADSWLTTTGVGRVVAFRAELSLRTLILLLAAFESGRTIVPVHPRWTAQEVDGFVRIVGADWLDLPETFEPVTRQSSRAATRRTDEPGRPLAILATSGTSGQPRGVALSPGAFAASAAASSAVLPWQEDDRWLLGLPLAHVGGLSILTRCLAAGRCLVLPTTGGPTASSFDAEATLERVQRQRVTRMSVVPTQLCELSLAPAPACLRVVLVGGAAAAPAQLERARSRGWPVLCTYGMTETCSQVTLQRPSEPLRTGSSGRPLPGVALRIVEGRIEVRGPTLLTTTVPATGALAPDGWYRTSDVGELRDGELFVLGRADDVIISGGENVHPTEVERVLVSHPAIHEACVFGLSDTRWGELLACAIACRDPSQLRGLDAWLRERLASFKRPRRIAVFSELAHNATGKLDRELIRRWSMNQLQSLDALDAD